MKFEIHTYKLIYHFFFLICITQGDISHLSLIKTFKYLIKIKPPTYSCAYFVCQHVGERPN